MKICDRCKRNDLLLEIDERVNTYLLRIASQFDPAINNQNELTTSFELCPHCFKGMEEKVVNAIEQFLGTQTPQ